MNLFAPAEIAANYAEAGVKKTSLPVSKMLLLGILADVLGSLDAQGAVAVVGSCGTVGCA